MSLRNTCVTSLLWLWMVGVVQAGGLETVPRDQAWEVATAGEVVFLDLYAEW